MITIIELRKIVETVRSLPDRSEKEAYLNQQSREILNFLGSNITKDGIAKKTAEAIPISELNKSMSDMEDIIEIFADASTQSKKKDKIRLMNTIWLTPEDREFVLTTLFGSLKLGMKIPLPDPIFGETIKPMLCGTKEFNPKNCIIEHKWDGIRCIASNNNGKIILQSRNGKILDVPVIERSLISVLPKGVTVDGEIVASDGQFQSLDRKGNNLIYQIYDILFYDNVEMINYSLSYRKDFINRYIITNDYIKISTELNLNSIEEIDAWIIENEAEGIVAKDPNSTYNYGDRKDWMKYKLFLECSAKVIDYNFGEGKREGKVGAINVIPEGLQAITKCGSGFNDEQLDEMKSLIDNSKDIIVNIKHFGITNDGCLRFPIFMAIRSINGDEI